MKAFYISIAFAVLFFSQLSFSQDQCSDVLNNGTFETASSVTKIAEDQLIISRFIQSNYQTSKSNKDLGFGVPVGEVVMGSLNYSENDYKLKKAQLQKEFSWAYSRDEEISVAVSTGDKAITSAWLECMKGRKGGLVAYFEILSAKEATLTVEFLSAANTSTRLKNTVELPVGVTVGEKRCISKWTKITSEEPCVTTVQLASATDTWNLALNSGSGSAKTYLPPRVKVVAESKIYPFPEDCLIREKNLVIGSRCDHQAYTENFGGQHDHRVITKVYNMPQDLWNDGWQFKPSTGRVSVVTHLRVSKSNMSFCQNAKVDEVSPARFVYQFNLDANRKEQKKNTLLRCTMEPSIEIYRHKVVPI